MASTTHRKTSNSNLNVTTFLTESKKFTTICKKNELYYPENICKREKAHLEICMSCRVLWALFVWEKIHLGDYSEEQLCREWQDILEEERIKLLRSYKKAEKIWIINFLSTERVDSVFNKNCQGQRWENLSREEKSIYVEKRHTQRLYLRKKMRELPIYKRKVVSGVKRSRKYKNKTGLKKPPGVILLYQMHRWDVLNEEEKKERPYKEWRKIFQLDWHKESEEVHNEYNAIYKSSMEEYTKKKEKQKKIDKKNKIDIDDSKFSDFSE